MLNTESSFLSDSTATWSDCSFRQELGFEVTQKAQVTSGSSFHGKQLHVDVPDEVQGSPEAVFLCSECPA